ncbi:hypothetical protein OBBRIDRAFT_138230 [Obba rivulosa]|uniref:Uncharacterized protein n=1 Tax=Obba rivulosa TaxID=1052685 RepID=A0A8E2ANX8_9APHY|nr:hypothetical protein OBBRIDRAFT_138230 [Obba rivulosa]
MMPPVTFNIPSNVQTIVLNISGNDQSEVAKLVADAEAKIRELTAEIVRLGGVRSVNEVPGVSDLVPFSIDTGKAPHEILKAVRRTLGKRIIQSVLAKNEFVWEDFFQSGTVYKPTCRVTKKGNFVPSGNKKLLQPQVEIVATTNFGWCYLGTYAGSLISETGTISATEFAALPLTLRNRVIALAGGRAARTPQVQSMYESGEFLAMKISLRRVGYNDAFQRLLVEIGQANVGPGYTSTADQEADDDETEWE